MTSLFNEYNEYKLIHCNIIRFFYSFQLKNKYYSNNIDNMENREKIDDSQDDSVTPNITDEEQTKDDNPDEEQTKEEKPEDSFKEFVGKTLRDGMDDNNKKAFDVLKTGGENAFLKHVFTREDGTQRSYAEMRYLYG